MEASHIVDAIFRSEDGKLVNGNQDLSFQLKDFGNHVDCPGIDDLPGSINISLSKLYAIAQEAEEIHQMQETRKKRSRSEPFPLGLTKRPRRASSPEELRVKDEQHFQDQERAAEDRAGEDDSKYNEKASSDA
jgi:hypothetical protein